MARKRKGEPISFEEKKEQVENIIRQEITEDPIEIFNPKGVKFTLKDKTYTIYPLTLRKLGIANRLQKNILSLSTNTNDDNIESIFEDTAECIAIILDKPQDKNFLLENLTVPMINYIFQKIGEISGNKKKP